jgi:endonuclease III
LLSTAYGKREQQLNQNPISVLVQTILSQNTSDRNSHKAFSYLLNSFDNWQAIANASTDEISKIIRPGGLGETKAKYIKQALEAIRHKRGNLELDFLKKLTVIEARDWLMNLPGVGMKTASCVLLFSLGMPALPVDTHIFRVSKRLGLIPDNISVNEAHEMLEKVVPNKVIYSFHILLIEHGRKICKAQRPRCYQCVLQKICPSYERLVKLNKL